MRSLASYSEDEIDAVLNHFDLFFMRDTITDEEMLGLLSSLGGACIVVTMRMKRFVKALRDAA